MPKIFLYRGSGLQGKDTRKAVHNRIVEYILRRETGTSEPSPLPIARQKRGKPYLGNFPDFFFNISDSGEYLAVGTGQRELGIDIETIRPRPFQDILERWFLPDERFPVEQASAPSTMLNRFIRLWTCKESLLKHIGCGLGAEMKNHPIRSEPAAGNGEPACYAMNGKTELCFHTLLIQNGRLSAWNAEAARPGDLVLTLCLEKGDEPVQEFILPTDFSPTESSRYTAPTVL